ncbi:hypothetical protein FRC03_005408 [Tulasnella sp. 419]|nr:hypothetical protein FRC03_005408 [Tulasnella sp. 419]
MVEIPRRQGLLEDKVDWTSIPPLCATLPSDILSTDLSDPPPLKDHYTHLLIDELEKSVRLRVQNIPKRQDPGSSRLALLFSGGIDCTVLAYLAHRCLPIEEPIDLLNVAFENPRSIRAKSQEQQRGKQKALDNKRSQGPPSNPVTYSIYDVPDRLSGLEELEELRVVCPGRVWRFVEIDVTYEESQRERPKIEEFMLPSRTVMDLSLALALYFASRGRGVVRESPSSDAVPYTSEARVLLSGLGSDELLGGYARHRHAFTKGSWQGLIDELQLDLDRLPTRNLGRDDRVISANGKETRYPFLSLSFVSFVASIPVEIKVDPRFEEGKGDKLILRKAAAQLGLVKASARKKRAMQFGSRSARMEGNESDRKGTLSLS